MNSFLVESIQKLQEIIKTELWRSFLTIPNIIQNIHELLLEQFKLIGQGFFLLHLFILVIGLWLSLLGLICNLFLYLDFAVLVGFLGLLLGLDF